MKVKKKNIRNIALGYAGLLIFVCIDDSMNMMMLLPITLLLMVLKSNKVFDRYLSKDLIILSIICSISLLLATLLNSESISLMSIIRLFYTFSIFAYVYFVCSERYETNDINFIIKGNILVAFIIGSVIIFRTFNGAHGKVSVINIFGNMVEENYTAAYMSFICLFNIFYFIYGKNKIISLICFFVTFLGILFTGSRAAFISVTIASSLIILFQFIFSTKITIKRKIVYLLVIGMIALFFINNLENILPEFIYNRFFVKSLADKSNNIRLQIWNYALEHIWNRPLFGYGIGNFSYYLSAIYQDNSTVIAHNTFIDILMDVGIIGFLYYMVFICKNLFYLLREKINIFPFIFVWLFTSFIVGGERTYFFWNDITLLIIIAKYCKTNKFNELFKPNSN